MAIPDVNIPIKAVRFPIEILIKCEQAVEKVHQRMLRTCRAMENASIPFVVIGGNAVGIWVATKDDGAVRNTRDVDILFSRGDLARATKAMADAGFDLAENKGMTMFLDREDPEPSRGVHVVFAEETVKPGVAFVSPPVRVGVRSDEGVPAIGLRDLLIMKLAASRNIDWVHVRDLLNVGLIDDALAEQIPPELRPRLEEIRANPDG